MNQLKQARFDSEARRAILKTVSYFDIFEYPLTLVEIYKWLYFGSGRHSGAEAIESGRISLNDIQEELSQMLDKIESKDGFYYLKGNQHHIQTRLQRYSIAEDKFQRAKKFIKILRYIPYIKMVAVCNSLSYSNSTNESDIDLLIITKKNRLWSARFWTLGFLKLAGVRPQPESKKDAIDATFFISEDSLNIENLKISEEDIYLIYWVDQLVPIFNPYGLYEKFYQSNNWIKNYLPNSVGYNLSKRRLVKRPWYVKLDNFFSRILLSNKLLEQKYKNYQLKILPPVLKQMMNQDTRVVVNEKVLKFHQTDRRAEYQKEFYEKIRHQP